ncbi:MAG: DnaJ domain-containing protein [Oscillospiraceae bacterium]|nr:DnaJ domain-containing protein [Oscillospiraceae bacterium]
MNDPYKILGVASSASDDEVKKAYRELVRKYHPDNYHDNPLSDLAQEKMKEVNEAYDAITRMRSGGGGGGTYRPGSGSAGSSGGSAEGQKVRVAINSGDLQYAEQLLKNFPARNAEWNFLMGSLSYRKGWLDDAFSFFQNASNMEPGNSEYRQALTFMSQGGHAYRSHGNGRRPVQGGGCDACDCCTAMLCMNLCCCN